VKIYCDVYDTNKTGSSSCDWIYSQLAAHSLIITLTQRQYSDVSCLHTLESTVAQALGFSVSTSRFPATDLDAQIVSLTLQIFHINLLVTKTVFSTHADNLIAHTLLELNCLQSLLSTLESDMRRTQRRVLLRVSSLKLRGPSLLLRYPLLPCNLPTQGSAKQGERRESKNRQRSATVVQSRSLRFLISITSRIGRLRHNI
jgi:hypothetical protein